LIPKFYFETQITNYILTAKEKDRKEVMRKRNVDFAVNYRD
jgi:hypothetical protein